MNAVADDRQFSYSPRDFDRVRQLIHAKAGIALAESKEDMVYSRLVRQLKALAPDAAELPKRTLVQTLDTPSIEAQLDALAGRKAKANVVGICGLVENMPDGGAQRPGDVVTSMSGQTIEVINTDAEGRLVLADALWYCQDRFKPKFMVDLATLTGAIIIALGRDYAGLFSNNDILSGHLDAAGKAENETLWRLPLPAAYEKQFDSPIADMSNVGGRPGGSITAALILQKFVNGTPWAHLDIAGVAWRKPSHMPTVPDGASGFGVRLLNRMVADAYED